MKSTAMFAAQSAGRILMSQFGKIDNSDIVHDYKHDFTTKADLEAERAIVKILRKKTPGFSILAEESGTERHRSAFTWVIDPLDGTTNYTTGNPFFDVSIALIKEQEPILAIVYAPVIEWMFVAEKGKGATLNNRPIKVSDKNKISQCLMTYCRGNDEINLKKTNKIFSSFSLKAKDFNRPRAGAYELGLIAAGKLGGFIDAGAKSWDVAAGTLLVREAGGKVTDFDGKEWSLESKDIVATNGAIHKQTLDEIKKALK